jgi:hypothetical protein
LWDAHRRRCRAQKLFRETRLRPSWLGDYIDRLCDREVGQRTVTGESNRSAVISLSSLNLGAPEAKIHIRGALSSTICGYAGLKPPSLVGGHSSIAAFAPGEALAASPQHGHELDVGDAAKQRHQGFVIRPGVVELCTRQTSTMQAGDVMRSCSFYRGVIATQICLCSCVPDVCFPTLAPFMERYAVEAFPAT